MNGRNAADIVRARATAALRGSRIISSMSTTTAPLTVEEFFKLPDIEEQRIQLIHGEVVDMPSGGPAHETVKSNLIGVLYPWLTQYRAGKIFVESGYRLDERTELVPALSVLGSERLKRPIEERFRGAPDLAVEVVSSETATRLRTKIGLYLRYGSKAVWVVYPEQRLVEIHSATGAVAIFEQDQLLEERDALPGFSTPVAAILEGL